MIATLAPSWRRSTAMSIKARYSHRSVSAQSRYTGSPPAVPLVVTAAVKCCVAELGPATIAKQVVPVVPRLMYLRLRFISVT